MVSKETWRCEQTSALQAEGGKATPGRGGRSWYLWDWTEPRCLWGDEGAAEVGDLDGAKVRRETSVAGFGGHVGRAR